jgi:hypothetical protein
MLSALDTAPRHQVVRHLLGHLQRHVFLRLRGRGAEMRGADDVGHRTAGFSVAGSSNTSKAAPATWPDDRLGQRRLVDQAAARAVDDAHALLGLGQVLGRQDAAVLSVIGTCSVMKSALCQQLVELDLGHAHLLGAFLDRNGS